MASISDVARLAGVSPTTVSHAISGKRKVSVGLREKVERAMLELDFVPTRAAQSLALGKTSLVALVTPDIGIEYFAELAKSVESAVVARGYNVIIATTGFDAEREAQYLEMIGSRAVDGVIFSSGAPLDARARRVMTSRLPVVLVDEEIAGVDLHTIISDNEAGGRIVAEHLLGLGHRTVLEIEGLSFPSTSLLRSEGFSAAWEGAGGRIVTARGDYQAASGQRAVEDRIDAFLAREITAVFAHNDLMALGAIDGLRRHGLHTPRDVSVVGFDDVSPGRYSHPRLTTVRQDVAMLGELAANTLLDTLEGGCSLTPERVLLPVELIVRDSTREVRA